MDFKPTSEPELDAILTHYRDTLFIPASLSEYHRRLIFSPKKRSLLLNDPGVTVTLPNEEDYKLKPMSLTDRPVKAQALVRIREILSSTQDDNAWSNLLPFLEGMQASKEPVHKTFLGAIARKANEQGQHQLTMRCAELAQRTDFRLCYHEITKWMFLGCHDRATATKFQGDDLLSAAKQAEDMALLMEKEEHCGGKLPKDGKDMRQSLMVVGVLLELAAAKSIQNHGKKDIDGKVASYTRRALALSEAGFDGIASESAVKPDPADPEASEPSSESRASRSLMPRKGNFVIRYSPLWHGMKLASEVDGAISADIQASFNDRFKSLEQALKKTVAEIRSATEHQPKYALAMYDKLKSL